MGPFVIISFLASRYLFIILSFLTPYEDGLVDVLLLMGMFLFTSGMFFGQRPLIGRWNNFLGRFNAFAMLVCTYHLMMVTDISDQEFQYYVGWSLITVIMIFIVVNLLYFAIDMFDSINLVVMMLFG